MYSPMALSNVFSVSLYSGSYSPPNSMMPRSILPVTPPASL